MTYLDDVQAARAALVQLRKDLLSELAAARRHDPRDPSSGQALLTEQGLANRRIQLEAEVRAKFAPKIAELAEDVELRAGLIRGDADRARPTFGSDAASAMAVQRGWDAARLKLDAGMSLDTVIKTAGENMLLGIREWAPSWIEAQHYREHAKLGLGAGEWTPPDHTGLYGRIDAAFASHLDPERSAALLEARDAAGEVAACRVAAGHLDRMVSGTSHPGDGLGSAIDGYYADVQAQGLSYDPATSEGAEA